MTDPRTAIAQIIRDSLYPKQPGPWLTSDDIADSILAALPGLGFGRQEWRWLSETPTEPVQVEFFCGNVKYIEDQHGNKLDPLIEPGRDARRQLGFWAGECWCEDGTGHPVHEREWAHPDWVPTHYRILPAPPSTDVGNPPT